MMRLLRYAAQKQIFSPPSQALPGTAVVRRLRLIPSPGRAWGRERVPFLLEGLASALWTTRNDKIHYVRNNNRLGKWASDKVTPAMTTITLELPEDLAVRLDPLRDRLPELLSQLLDLESAERKFTLSGTVMTHPVLLELIDFLSARPTAKQVLTHKSSSAVQERLEELLDKNREVGLTAAEEEEMDAYRLVNHVMILLKARARPAVSSPQAALP
jgi:hypothetical protein